MPLWYPTLETFPPAPIRPESRVASVISMSPSATSWNACAQPTSAPREQGSSVGAASTASAPRCEAALRHRYRIPGRVPTGLGDTAAATRSFGPVSALPMPLRRLTVPGKPPARAEKNPNGGQARTPEVVGVRTQPAAVSLRRRDNRGGESRSTSPACRTACRPCRKDV